MLMWESHCSVVEHNITWIVEIRISFVDSVVKVTVSHRLGI